MTETTATRVGRIISGSFNSVLDAIENAVPESVMEQSIREIERAILDVRSELGRLLASKHLAKQRLAAEQDKLFSLNEQIKIALVKARNDLAETAIAKQLDIEAQIPILETTLGEASSKEKELGAYIQALLARKREMQDELRQFKASQSTPKNTVGPDSSGRNIQTRAEKASNSFERVLENVSGVSNRVDNPNSEDATRLMELEDMARKNRIQERLAEFIRKNRD